VASLLALSPALRIPYPILLVLGGLAIGVMPGMPNLELDRVSGGRGALAVRVVRHVAREAPRGPVTKGEAARYLAELPWAAAAMTHNHELHWREVDERTVEVATSVAGQRLAVLLRFDDAGDVVAASCDDLPRAVGTSSIETPWIGEFSNYAVLGGVRVPTRAEVRWDLPDGPFVYFRGQLTELALGQRDLRVVRREVRCRPRWAASSAHLVSKW